jgi:hypothetical protein
MNYALTTKQKSFDQYDTSLTDYQVRKPTSIWDIDHP